MKAPGEPMPPRRPGAAAYLVEALLALALAFVLLPVAGGLLQRRFGIFGLAATELLLVLMPALVFVAIARVPFASALGLRRPSARSLAGAAIAGAAGFYLVAGGLEVLQERVAPLPPGLREELRQLLLPPTGPRALAVDLVVLALLPALCEELLFRGLLLRAIVPFNRTAALLFTSVAFGAFHFSAYKFLPTTTLGFLLGLMALRAGSIWASVLAHALNNTLVVMLLRAGYEDPPGAGAPIGVLALVFAVPAVAVGLLLIRPTDRAS